MNTIYSEMMKIMLGWLSRSYFSNISEEDNLTYERKAILLIQFRVQPEDFLRLKKLSL